MRWNSYRPTKAAAIVGLFVGAGMIVFGIIVFGQRAPLFIVFWCLAVVAISAVNFYRAFSSKAQRGDTPDIASQIEKLSELHRFGKISNEEFAAAKTKLLAPPRP